MTRVQVDKLKKITSSSAPTFGSSKISQFSTGSGLGLQIAKIFLSYLGPKLDNKLDIISKFMKGSTFSFKIQNQIGKDEDDDYEYNKLFKRCVSYGSSRKKRKSCLL